MKTELIRRNGTVISKEQMSGSAPDVALSLVSYMSDGLKVKGMLAVPNTNQRYPGLIYCRGGIHHIGMVRPEKIIPISRLGYAVFAPYYRGNEGGEGREDFGGDDRNDVYHAVTAIHSLEEVAPGPIPLIGFSRGSIMALLAAKDCAGIGPVVVWGGVSDLLVTYEERIDLRRMLRRVVGHPKKQAEQYYRRSPVYWVQDVHVPILIVHGTEDENVGLEHALKLAGILMDLGKTYELKLYEGAGHAFPEPIYRRALDDIHTWIEQQMNYLSIPT